MTTDIEALEGLPEVPSVKLDMPPTIETVWIRPTQRWLGKSQRIPRGRKISRTGLTSPIEVTAEEANYLIKNFFAVKIEAPAADPEPITPEPVATEELTTPAESSQEREVTPPEFNLETLAAEYLNHASAEEIAHAIKGIGRKTAEELVESRPLDWEAVLVILSDRQVEAVKAFVGSGTSAKVEDA